MEIDHITIPVQDYDVAKRFYADALRPIGYDLLLDWPDQRRAYFGPAAGPSCVWIVESEAAGTLDVALALEKRGDVIAFHNAALAAGARSLAGPSVSRDRHAGYFAARIADFDGNELEAVCHELAARAAA